MPTPRATGWSSATPLAWQWTERLAGKQVFFTQTAGGGSAGSAETETSVAFCPQRQARLQKKTTTSVSVPGLSGSQTGRGAEDARWRVLTQGNQVSLAITGGADDEMQIGVRSGPQAGTIYLGDKLVRLGQADCS